MTYRVTQRTDYFQLEIIGSLPQTAGPTCQAVAQQVERQGNLEVVWFKSFLEIRWGQSLRFSTTILESHHMFVHCVGCEFEGYVDDCEHQLCHGCRHDPGAIASAERASQQVVSEDVPALGNDFWAEYYALLGQRQ